VHRATWRRLSPAAAFRRATTVVDTSGLLPVVEHNLVATTGRPREFTARAFLVGCTLHSVLGAKRLVMTDIAETLHAMPPSQRHELGVGRAVTYPMLWHAFTKLAELFDSGGLFVPGTDERLTVQQFADRLLAVSTPNNYVRSSSVAIDGTDLETWGRRRSWGNKKTLSTAGTEIPEGTVIAPDKPVNESGWPRIGADGRPQHSPDPDARDGYRSGHNGKRGDIYHGYELHLATQLPGVGGPAVPHLIVGMTLAPAGTHRGNASVRTIDGLTATDSRSRSCASTVATRSANRKHSPTRCGNATSKSGPTCTRCNADNDPDPSPAPSGSTAPYSATHSRRQCGP